MTWNLSRRDFLHSTGAAGLGLAMAGLPHIVSGQANDKVRVLSIGVVGTIGGADRGQVANHPSAEIAGLCDVEILRSGALGKAVAGYAWTGSPGPNRYFNFDRVVSAPSSPPPHIDWDLWQ